MSRTSLILLLSFFFYPMLQVIVFQHVALFEFALCFPYVMFILLLAVETNVIVLMLLAFVTGIVVDVFYDSLGLHASALVFIAFIRNFWLSKITPRGGYDIGKLPTMGSYGISWFLTYTCPLVWLHHAMLFFIEGGGTLVGHTLLKISASFLFTLLVILLIQSLTWSKSKK